MVKVDPSLSAAQAMVYGYPGHYNCINIYGAIQINFKGNFTDGNFGGKGGGLC